MIIPDPSRIIVNSTGPIEPDISACLHRIELVAKATSVNNANRKVESLTIRITVVIVYRFPGMTG